jgi:hypothetical protein
MYDDLERMRGHYLKATWIDYGMWEIVRVRRDLITGEWEIVDGIWDLM